MKLLYGSKSLSQCPAQIAATIGNFDGVHCGHQALLARLIENANQRNLPTLVILFEPQPDEFFNQKDAALRLSTLREKIGYLAQWDIDYVLCLKFQAKLAEMPAEDFAQRFFFSRPLITYLLVGEDFQFGKKRCGDSKLLQEMALKTNTTVEIFKNFTLNNERISSTIIRNLFQKGALAQGASLLGRDYEICGRVVSGTQQGRKWGIPTANIHRYLPMPIKGVFCVQVTNHSNSNCFQGVANVGCRPTVDGNTITIEIHMFDTTENFYGQHLRVRFLRKLRDEIKFDSIDILIAQINKDIDAAKSYFKLLN